MPETTLYRRPATHERVQGDPDRNADVQRLDPGHHRDGHAEIAGAADERPQTFALPACHQSRARWWLEAVDRRPVARREADEPESGRLERFHRADEVRDLGDRQPEHESRRRAHHDGSDPGAPISCEHDPADPERPRGAENRTQVARILHPVEHERARAIGRPNALEGGVTEWTRDGDRPEVMWRAGDALAHGPV